MDSASIISSLDKLDSDLGSTRQHFQRLPLGDEGKKVMKPHASAQPPTPLLLLPALTAQRATTLIPASYAFVYSWVVLVRVRVVSSNRACSLELRNSARYFPISHACCTKSRRLALRFGIIQRPQHGTEFSIVQLSLFRTRSTPTFSVVQNQP